MKSTIRKFSSFEEMEEAKIQEAISYSPKERLRQLGALKKQAMALGSSDGEGADQDFQANGLTKKKVPWSK